MLNIVNGIVPHDTVHTVHISSTESYSLSLSLSPHTLSRRTVWVGAQRQQAGVHVRTVIRMHSPDGRNVLRVRVLYRAGRSS